MKSIVFCIIVFISSCNNERQNIPEQNKEVSFKDTKNNINDTFCYSNVAKFNDPKIKLIKACHVIFSDSLSNKVSALFGAGKLVEEYNFDNHSSKLSYSKVNDTITLKLLYLIHIRNHRLIPDTVFTKNDTLFVRQKGELLADSSSTNGLKFEEFYYKFLAKDREFNPVLRYLF